MDASLKLQIFFAVILVGILLAMTMILIRTLANLEHSMDRLEEIVNREIQLRGRFLNKQKELADKAKDGDKAARNELLLNIPFLEKLNKERTTGDK